MNKKRKISMFVVEFNNGNPRSINFRYIFTKHIENNGETDYKYKPSLLIEGIGPDQSITNYRMDQRRCSRSAKYIRYHLFQD